MAHVQILLPFTDDSLAADQWTIQSILFASSQTKELAATPARHLCMNGEILSLERTKPTVDTIRGHVGTVWPPRVRS